jgi:hypothetical protein
LSLEHDQQSLTPTETPLQVPAVWFDGRKSFSALRECEFSFVKCNLMVGIFKAPIFSRDHCAEANDVS